MSEPEKFLQPERLAKIQELLSNRHTVKVSELGEELEVSENTIRRDLAILEKAGICYRTKGGAGLLQSSVSGAAFAKRLSDNREAKKGMALKASEMVKRGDTVILDSGTTAFELALKLREMEHITVITASLEASQVLAGLPDLTLIVSGGIVNHSSRSMTGPPAEAFFETVHADILFLAVRAVSVENGLTDYNMNEASLKQKMIKCAKKIVLLADHSKINQTALSYVADLESVNALVTDSGTDPLFLEKLRNKGIEIYY